MYFNFLKSVFVFGVWIICVTGQTTWVWNKSQTPNNGNTGNTASIPSRQNANFGEVNFGRDRDRFGNQKQSIFPDSPSRPSSSSKQNDNSALPADSIRLINNGNSEARLIPGAASFVSNALQSIGGNGGNGGNGGGGGAGLFSIGGNFIGSLFQSVPQLAGSALEILLGRPSKGNSASSNSNNGGSRPSNIVSGGASTLPASASGTLFPILTPGGSSSPSKTPNLNSASSKCKCVPAIQCFLPNMEGGSCAGGNIMCCPATTRNIRTPGLRIVDDLQGTQDSNPVSDSANSAPNPADVRLGLFENIVKGGSNVVDDALDLLLLRYYTDDDQQRLANRVLKSG